MIRACLVESNVVVNVAKFKDEDDVFDGWESCDQSVGIGYLKNNDGTFSPSNPLDPDPDGQAS